MELPDPGRPGRRRRWLVMAAPIVGAVAISLSVVFANQSRIAETIPLRARTVH